MKGWGKRDKLNAEPEEVTPPPLEPEASRTIKLKKSNTASGEQISFSPGMSTLGADQVEASALDKVIETLGVVFYNTINHTWLSVSDVDETLDRAFDVMEKALAEKEEITFSIVDEKLRVDKEAYPVSTRSGRTFVEHLMNMDASHFTIYKDLPRAEFMAFMGMLTLSPEKLREQGGFYDAVNNEKLTCVKAVKVFVQEVTEEETVVSKREMERKLEEQRVQAENDVFALLCGEEGDGSDLQQVAASAHSVANDSSRMAGMIMEVAESEHGGGQEPSKSAALVNCLRRAFNGLMKDPSLKTQKGKKALMKTLRELEKEILVQMGDGSTATAKAAVSEAIEMMTDEIQMDAIAAEYTKRLKAIEQSEKRILRFIKAHNIDKVE